MATITKLKAEVYNENLPILGNDGKVYSYYYGRFFNAITEKGYTPTSGEKAALETFIQNGIDNGWIDIVKYFLPLIGDSSHLIAAAVPLIDRVGDYAMSEYSGSENFTNSFEVEGGKVKYYAKMNTVASQLISPLTCRAMDGGISFSGFIRRPEVFNDTIRSDRYASIKMDNDEDKYILQVRYHETTSGAAKNHELGYLAQLTDSASTFYPLNFPSKATIEELNASHGGLVVNYALYKDNGVVKRLRNFKDVNGGQNYSNVEPDTAFTYPDYSLNQSTMKFGLAAPPTQKFGCLGVLDAARVTSSLISSYNDAVLDLMTALGR